MSAVNIDYREILYNNGKYLIQRQLTELHHQIDNAIHTGLGFSQSGFSPHFIHRLGFV